MPCLLVSWGMLGRIAVAGPQESRKRAFLRAPLSRCNERRKSAIVLSDWFLFLPVSVPSNRDHARRDGLLDTNMSTCQLAVAESWEGDNLRSKNDVGVVQYGSMRSLSTTRFLSVSK